MTADRVVVVGGGLAGISAAIELAEHGLPVTLLESRPWLGGATWSFGRRGLTIDNGQHAFLRCFTAYQDLLIRLGVRDSVALQDRLDLTVLAADGSHRIRRNSLPAPLHLAGTLASYGLLSRGERLGVVPAVMAMWLSDLSRPGRASVAEWLRRHGQGERARRRLWEVFLVPVLNAVSEQADLSTAAGVINAALLTSRDRADIGMSSVPLRDLHGRPAATVLATLGVEVRVCARAAALTSMRGGGFSVRVDSVSDESQSAQMSFGHQESDEIYAAGVVLAVPAWSAAELVPPELSADVNAWRKLTPSPVVSIHVTYGASVTRLPFALSGDSSLRWIADKTRSAGLRTGQYLAASIPAADKFVDAPSAALREKFLPVLDRLFPAAASAGVEDFFVTRERSATFRPVPGSAAFRPDQMTNLPGFALAGAWTNTGWPDTMEGAVRSGRRAADCVLRALAPAEADTVELDRLRPRMRVQADAWRAVTTRFAAELSGHTATPAGMPAAAARGDAAASGATAQIAVQETDSSLSERAMPAARVGSAEVAKPAPDAEPANGTKSAEVGTRAEGAESANGSGLAAHGPVAAKATPADTVTPAGEGTSAGKVTPAGKGWPAGSGVPAASGKRAASARRAVIKEPVALNAPDAVPERAKAAGQ